MIVDTSAVVAILLGEPEAEGFIEALLDARTSRMSAATYVEAAVVVDANRDPVLSARFDELVTEIEVVPMTQTQTLDSRPIATTAAAAVIPPG